jgi:hypothetical protein
MAAAEPNTTGGIVRFWRPVQATAIAVCALPGIVFTVVGLAAGSTHSFETRSAQNVWEMVIILDYFMMIGLSPILVPLMWLVRWTARRSFSPTAKAMLTFIAVWGTIGTAFFWIRLFS